VGKWVKYVMLVNKVLGIKKWIFGFLLLTENVNLGNLGYLGKCDILEIFRWQAGTEVCDIWLDGWRVRKGGTAGRPFDNTSFFSHG
jgi:hypothetical protein